MSLADSPTWLSNLLTTSDSWSVSMPRVRNSLSMVAVDTIAPMLWSHTTQERWASFTVCATKSMVEKPPRSAIWKSKKSPSRLISATESACEISRTCARLAGNGNTAMPLA
ncbi:hypothetical protein D9M69_730770 [compost metagenome]